MNLSEVCLVTGGAGFIGCAISAKLARHFDRVVAIDSLHPQIHPERVRPSALSCDVELVVGDVLQATTWHTVLDDITPTVVIHLAAETGTGQSLRESNRHALVNVCGTTTMLDALICRNKLPKRIVLASSRAIYGEGAWRDLETQQVSSPGQRSREMFERGLWDFPGQEPLPHSAISTPAHPTSVYGSTKLAQEHILSSWALAFGVELLTLRLQNVYGPGQSLSNPYTGIVSLFAQLARAHSEIPVYEDGKITRDFVYIDDVADAILKAAVRGAASSLPYDIGSGSTTSLLDLARLIANHYGAPEPKVTGNFRNGDVRHASCDISRAAAELSWIPQWEIQNGIAELCSWIDRQIR